MFIARISLKLRAVHRGAFREFVRDEGLQARRLPGRVD
jgi:hypothetical protein